MPIGKTDVGNSAFPSTVPLEAPATTGMGLPSWVLPALSTMLPVGAFPILFVIGETFSKNCVGAPNTMVRGAPASVRVVAWMTLTVEAGDVLFLKFTSPG